VQGNAEEQLKAFRQTADELRKRLSDWITHL
jgi:hypothetical protein